MATFVRGFNTKVTKGKGEVGMDTRSADEVLRSLVPKHMRQLSVSSSNALDQFAVIESLLFQRRLVLLLDYDGTLTPIVNDPSKAILSEEVRSILRELPKHFVTGVVSGRGLKKIRDFVNVPGLFYAGSHGFDILVPGQGGQRDERDGAGDHPGKEPADGDLKDQEHWPNMLATATLKKTPSIMELALLGVVSGASSDGLSGGRGSGSDWSSAEEVRHQVAAEYLPILASIKQQLIQELASVKGSEVEDNIFSISVHYRNCPRELVPAVTDIVTKIQSEKNQSLPQRIRLNHGKMVYELQPDIKWDKGKAVMWLLDQLVFPPSARASGGSIGGKDDGKFNTEEDEEDGGVFTIFIGDDKTDENAFKVFQKSSNTPKCHHAGIGILVSEESRPTNAAYTLKNPKEVSQFLSRLALIGRERQLLPVGTSSVSKTASAYTTNSNQTFNSKINSSGARGGVELSNDDKSGEDNV